MELLASIDDAHAPEHRIEGVELRELRTNRDDRGFFRELIRGSDPFFAEGFGQWSHSLMQRHTLKAWHYHHRQVDWWYAPVGSIEVVLYDDRAESPTHGRALRFLLGDGGGANEFAAVVRIPPGVVHGCLVLSEAAHLFYVTSREYDPDDEGRYRFDSSRIPHRWGGSPNEWIISERDRVDFTPPHERAACDQNSA